MFGYLSSLTIALRKHNLASSPKFFTIYLNVSLASLSSYLYVSYVFFLPAFQLAINSTTALTTFELIFLLPFTISSLNSIFLQISVKNCGFLVLV